MARYSYLFGLATLLLFPTSANATPDFKLLAAVFDAGKCIECHSSDGVASDTRLVFPAYESSEERVREFGEWLLELVDTKDSENSRLLRKPTERMKHAGGKRIAPGTADEAALRAWVAMVAANPREASAILGWVKRPLAETGGRVLRRLTARQYDNTVQALLGDRSGLGRTFPPEDFVDGFQNQHLGQGASPVLIETYNNAAQVLADNAVRAITNGDPAHLLPCKLAEADSACRDRFIAHFGRRAMRRPLFLDEEQAFVRQFSGQPDFASGLRIVIESMLQSPSFLYLFDSSDPRLSQYARASRLSYFLWNTMPDEALFEIAKNGQLKNGDDVERVTRSMLNDPAAVSAIDEFSAQWLRFDRVMGSFKDRRTFRAFNADVARAMTEETRALVRHLVWNNMNFMELFTSRYTFATPELSKIYGLEAPVPGNPRIAYPPDSERTGILGHGSFLVATSKPSETSPTARGLYIRELFLCQTTPPPPPSVNMDLPTFEGDRPLTSRERLAQHLSDPSCASCHRLVDPVGFAFERFDAIGGYGDKMKVVFRPPQKVDDDGKPLPSEPSKTFELEVDTAGSILGVENSEFKGPREIGITLSKNDQCQLCVVKQLFRYAMGRKESSSDEAILKQMLSEFKKAKYRFKELLVSVARTTEMSYTPVTAPTSAQKSFGKGPGNG
ncbi:MAG: DUF1592 domain-containing protein [Deltaproteobacteria bacterium]|nr:DUF1592 domain-containing protein [Deltaproteobacteria bacterium]